MTTIIIGCRHPSGLVIEAAGQVITLEGQRQAQERSPIIILSEDDYGTTEVDGAVWEAWKKQVGADFAPLKSGMLFEAKSEKDAKAKARDLKDEKTGHEAMPQNDGKVSKV